MCGGGWGACVIFGSKRACHKFYKQTKRARSRAPAGGIRVKYKRQIT